MDPHLLPPFYRLIGQILHNKYIDLIKCSRFNPVQPVSLYSALVQLLSTLIVDEDITLVLWLINQKIFFKLKSGKWWELKSKTFSRGACPQSPIDAWVFSRCLGNQSLSQIHACLSEVILARSLYHKLTYFFNYYYYFFATSFYFHSLWILIFSTALQSFWLFKVWEWQTIRSWKIRLNWSKKEWKYDR